MNHFSHQISWNSWFLSKKQVVHSFLTIPHSSFRLCFALRMERSVDSHEIMHFHLKIGALQKFRCIPPLNLPAFWAAQEITWPPENHWFLGIEQKPRTRVTEFHQDFSRNSQKSCFSWKFRFRRDANKAAGCARHDFCDFHRNFIEKTSIWPRIS